MKSITLRSWVSSSKQLLSTHQLWEFSTPRDFSTIACPQRQDQCLPCGASLLSCFVTQSCGPQPFHTGDRFCGRQFFHGLGGGGGLIFGMIQAHCIHCARCFYHYYIRLHLRFSGLTSQRLGTTQMRNDLPDLLPHIWSVMLSVRPKTLQEIELNWSKTSCKRSAEHFCVAFIIRKKRTY